MSEMDGNQIRMKNGLNPGKNRNPLRVNPKDAA